MESKIRRAISVFLAICFLMSLTVASSEASEAKMVKVHSPIVISSSPVVVTTADGLIVVCSPFGCCTSLDGGKTWDCNEGVCAKAASSRYCDEQITSSSISRNTYK